MRAAIVVEAAPTPTIAPTATAVAQPTAAPAPPPTPTPTPPPPTASKLDNDGGFSPWWFALGGIGGALALLAAATLAARRLRKRP